MEGMERLEKDSTRVLAGRRKKNGFKGGYRWAVEESEGLLEDREKDCIRDVARRTGEGWYQRCFRKNGRKMVSEALQEKREKDGVRVVARRTGEGWYQRCCRKNRKRMVSEVLQEEREKDGMKGVARKNGREG